MEPKKEAPEPKKEMKMEAKMPPGWEPKNSGDKGSKSTGKKLCPKCNRQMSCNCK